ncbi:MAG: hypothetical protein AB8H79_06515 [Myxococcota bacterium]
MSHEGERALGLQTSEQWNEADHAGGTWTGLSCASGELMANISRTLSPLPPRERVAFGGAVPPRERVPDTDEVLIDDPPSLDTPGTEQAADPISLDDVGPWMNESIADRSHEYDPSGFVNFRRLYQSKITPERFLRAPYHGNPAWNEQDLAAEEAEVVIPRIRVSESAPVEDGSGADRRHVRLALAVAGALVAIVLAATLWMLTV